MVLPSSQPSGAGNVLAECRRGEVVGPQQLMNQGVIGGQPGSATADQPTAGSEFVGEPARVGAHGRVGDQPALHLTALGAERRQPTNHAV